MLGQVSHNDINKYYDMIDIICLPRMDCEVCNLVAPLKPYEGMIKGKIIFGSNVEPIKEILQNDLGILFNKNDMEDLVLKLNNIINSKYELENIQKEKNLILVFLKIMITKKKNHVWKILIYYVKMKF